MRYLLFVMKNAHELKFENRDLELLRTRGKESGQYKITNLDGDIIEMVVQ